MNKMITHDILCIAMDLVVCIYCHYDLRKYNFTNRVIPIWNSLSNHVVSAETVNNFKNRLDKFWLDKEVLYDYKTDLHGIGNRSIVQ